MKKLVSFLLMMALLCGCFGAYAEAVEELSVDEMLNFCDAMITAALQSTPLSSVEAEEGYAHDYGGYCLYTDTMTITDNSRVLCVEVHGEGCDMRGIGGGSTLDTLLAAYPLDNTFLSGTYDEAALYIHGMLPGTVNTGRVVRSGSHVLVVEHDTYNADGEDVEKCCVVYTLENNVVIASQVYLAVQMMSMEEAALEIEQLGNLQEMAQYSMYRETEPAPLAREDLLFGAVDFLTADAATLRAAFGTPESETLLEDGSEVLLVMQWEGAQAVLDKRNDSVMLLESYGEWLEGPRGLHMGDSLESILQRFPECVCESDGMDSSVLCALEIEGRQVILSLTVIHGALADIVCTYNN